MKKRRVAAAFVVAAAMIMGSIFAWNSTKNNETEPEYVFFYAENQSEDYPTTLGAQRFADLVEERTDGRIRILVQSEGVLGTEKEVIRQMQYGGIDFARVSLSPLAGYVPILNTLQMPYLYKDSEHMWRVLDGEIGNMLLKEMEDADLVGLAYLDAGVRNFYNSQRPITCLEDMEGLRIRVQESDMVKDMVDALGATGVQMEYENVYSNLERGIVDGAENNWPSYESMKHYEVAKYYTVDEHTRVPEVQICSIHTWEKLSETDQEIILACAREASLYERELWIEREEESRRIVIENGVEVVELTDEEKTRFQSAVMGVYEKYCGDYMDVIDAIIEEGNMEGLN